MYCCPLALGVLVIGGLILSQVRTNRDSEWLEDLKSISRSLDSVQLPWLNKANSLTVLKCCGLSHSTLCTNLCIKASKGSNIEDWHTFNNICVGMFEAKLNSSLDKSLQKCITNALLPCQKGCACGSLQFCGASLEASGLQYFRHCRRQSDFSAELQFGRLSFAGRLYIPMGVSLARVVSSFECSTILKMYVCLFFMQPCDLQHFAKKLCLHECISFLTKCIEWHDVRPNYSAMNVICASWGANGITGKCHSRNKVTLVTEDLYQDVCLYNPCVNNSTYPVCVAQPSHSSVDSCHNYQCAKGCQISKYPIKLVVPINSPVLLSVPKSSPIQFLGETETQYEESQCRCSVEGKLSNCSYSRLKMVKRGNTEVQFDTPMSYQLLRSSGVISAGQFSILVTLVSCIYCRYQTPVGD